MAWSSVPVLIGFSAIWWCFFKKSGNFPRLFLLFSIVAHINNSACNAFNLWKLFYGLIQFSMILSGLNPIFELGACFFVFHRVMRILQPQGTLAKMLNIYFHL